MTRDRWWARATLVIIVTVLVDAVIAYDVVGRASEHATVPVITAQVIAIDKQVPQVVTAAFRAPDGRYCRGPIRVDQPTAIDDYLEVRTQHPYCRSAYLADDNAPLRAALAIFACLLLSGLVALRLRHGWRRWQAIDAVVTSPAFPAAPTYVHQVTDESVTWPVVDAPRAWLLKPAPVVLVALVALFALSGVWTWPLVVVGVGTLSIVTSVVRVSWRLELTTSTLRWHGPLRHGQASLDQVRRIRSMGNGLRHPLAVAIVLANGSRVIVATSSRLPAFVARLRQVAPQVVVDRW